MLESANARSIVANGRDRRSALAGLLDQLSQAIAPHALELSSRSVVASAEGTTFEEMALNLCNVLLDLTDREGSAGLLEFDGMVQTDDGYAGWGHILLGVGDTLFSAPELLSLTANAESGNVRLIAMLSGPAKGE